MQVSLLTAAVLGTSLLSTALATLDVKSFQVVTPSIIDNYDFVKVEFVLSDDSTELDNRIAAYCIDEDVNVNDVDDTSYIAFRSTRNQTESTLSFGPMINMRCKWQFRLLNAANVAVAHSSVVKVGGSQQPTQVHLAMTTSPTQMRVSWTSAAVTEAFVYYGTEEAHLDLTSAATGTTYTADNLCDAPANLEAPLLFRAPGELYTAVMTDLVPGMSYYYRVGDTSGHVSDIFEFTMPAQTGQLLSDDADGSGTSDSFFVLSNLACSNITAIDTFAVEGKCGTTMKLIDEDIANNNDGHHYTAAMHLGDLSYAAGITYRWDQFGFLIQRVASKIPYMINIGHRDYGMDNGECGIPTLKRFVMPNNGNQAFWYSYEMGLAHHSVITSEVDYTVGSALYNWLKNDLAGVDRSTTPWLFLHMHRPLYSSVALESQYNTTLSLRAALEPLVQEYGVNVVFAGHYQNYERTCPVISGLCSSDKTAPTYITVGSAGSNTESSEYYDEQWSVKTVQGYGYGRMHIYNASHALYEYVVNENASVADSVWLESGYTSSSTNNVDSDSNNLSSSISIIDVLVWLFAGCLLCIVLVFVVMQWAKKQRQQQLHEAFDIKVKQEGGFGYRLQAVTPPVS